ncbi:hypothetical protein, partial [Flavobacterium sp.]|uniref:hypothetical protein n=1 Tax=Flavobacterium sp. TaxID=239 RepID=UPI0037BE36D0
WNNQRYVFNGWTRYTTDPALIYNNLNTKYEKKDKLEMQKVPCELMKYDWNQFTDSDFCINPKQCSLMKANKKDHYQNMCFSFSKGERTFVYVKKSAVTNLRHLDLAHTPKHRSYNLSSISHTTTDVNQIKPLRPIKLVTKEKPKILKDCPPDKIRNPVTGRCISMKTAEKRNLVKGKDNNDKKPKDKDNKKPAKPIKDAKPKPKIINKKECIDGKIRDPNTGRCISLNTALKRGLVVKNKGQGGKWLTRLFPTNKQTTDEKKQYVEEHKQFQLDIPASYIIDEEHKNITAVKTNSPKTLGETCQKELNECNSTDKNDLSECKTTNTKLNTYLQDANTKLELCESTREYEIWKHKKINELLTISKIIFLLNESKKHDDKPDKSRSAKDTEEKVFPILYTTFENFIKDLKLTTESFSGSTAEKTFFNELKQLHQYIPKEFTIKTDHPLYDVLHIYDSVLTEMGYYTVKKDSDKGVITFTLNQKTT